ncbi:MAG: hypothetical protein ABR540_19495 [Acidimicrobiales bacterium]
MPCLVSPSVPTMVASASMRAVPAVNAARWRAHTPSRQRLTASWSAMIEVSSKRRQKSPAVVGSGRAAAPRPSRNTASLRRASMSSSRVPPHKAL